MPWVKVNNLTGYLTIGICQIRRYEQTCQSSSKRYGTSLMSISLVLAWSWSTRDADTTAYWSLSQWDTSMRRLLPHWSRAWFNIRKLLIPPLARFWSREITAVSKTCSLTVIEWNSTYESRWYHHITTTQTLAWTETGSRKSSLHSTSFFLTTISQWKTPYWQAPKINSVEKVI